MDNKLTLRINEKVIERAKLYAREHNLSLSKVVESYLDGITREKGKESKKQITPFVESLSGVIALDAELDCKMEHCDHLAKKHS